MRHVVVPFRCSAIPLLSHTLSFSLSPADSLGISKSVSPPASVYTHTNVHIFFRVVIGSCMYTRACINMLMYVSSNIHIHMYIYIYVCVCESELLELISLRATQAKNNINRINKLPHFNISTCAASSVERERGGGEQYRRQHATLRLRRRQAANLF